MKNFFFAYIKPTKEEFKQLWENCVITVDTNILLNFYRYRNETTNEFFSLFDKLKDRMFITYQASTEYFDDRLGVITEQEKAYSDLATDLSKKIEEPLQNQRKHPYIDAELLSQLTELGSKIKANLIDRSKEHSVRFIEDDIMSKIVSFFEEKLDKKLDDNFLQEIYAEGEKRYENKIPPGFEDKKKHGNAKYGDLVMWKQIINYSKQHQKDVIFVTDDQKDDWWYIYNGKTICPHPVLQNEFFKETDKKVYFYTAERFYQFASEFLREEVKQEILDEVRDVREEEIVKMEKISDNENTNNYNYEIISEEDLIHNLLIFKNKVLNGGYIGLKKFVTEYLANQDYEINHSYAIINKLEQSGRLKIFNHFDERLNHSVRVVEVFE